MIYRVDMREVVVQLLEGLQALQASNIFEDFLKVFKSETAF